MLKDGLSERVKELQFPPRGQPSRQRGHPACVVCAGAGGAGGTWWRQSGGRAGRAGGTARAGRASANVRCATWTFPRRHGSHWRAAHNGSWLSFQRVAVAAVLRGAWGGQACAPSGWRSTGTQSVPETGTVLERPGTPCKEGRPWVQAGGRKGAGITARGSLASGVHGAGRENHAGEGGEGQVYMGGGGAAATGGGGGWGGGLQGGGPASTGEVCETRAGVSRGVSEKGGVRKWRRMGQPRAPHTHAKQGPAHGRELFHPSASVYWAVLGTSLLSTGGGTSESRWSRNRV